jgi:hypothetical protein
MLMNGDSGSAIIFTFNCPNEGNYLVTVHYYIPLTGFGDKTNDLYVNGTLVASTVYTPNGAWTDMEVGRALLGQGENTIEIRHNWGWMGVDYIELPLTSTTDFADTPSPQEGADDVYRGTHLSWCPGKSPKTHDVYLGTGFDDVNTASRTSPMGVLVSQGQDANTYDPIDPLAYGKTYSWRIDEVDENNKTFKGKVWSFTVEPYAYPVQPAKATASGQTNPLSGATNTIGGYGLNANDEHSTIAYQMWLSKKNATPIWIQYEFTDVYKLHQMWVWNQNQSSELTNGLGAKDVTVEYSIDGKTWTTLAGVPEFAQATAEPNYVHNTTVEFGGVQAKYVKLTINSNWANTNKQSGLSEVRFYYVPVLAFLPQPATGATDVALDGVLNWRPGREAAQHDVYVSSNPNAVANGSAPFKTVSENSLGLSSLGLAYNKTYYWKVNEVNDAATPKSWDGTVWSFTTIGYEVVEDFESYNDLCNRIYFAWIDQYGHSESFDCGVPQVPGNGSGSTVGNSITPFAEQTIVHGGGQSMPLAYDNTTGPYYSETSREWTPPQSWIAGETNTLSVYLWGEPAAFVETSPGSFVMNGMGSDIWGTTDWFRFAYKQLSGNGTIIARVDAVANTDAWAKAGVMIRETLDADSALVMAVVAPSNRVALQWRSAKGADMANPDSTSHTAANGVTIPRWIKLTRTGNVFTVQHSADGVTWVDIVPETAGDPISATVPMSPTVYVGLAVTSHVADVACGARISNVSTTGSVTGAWQPVDIGVTQINGNALDMFYVALQDSSGKTMLVSNPDRAVVASGNWEQWDIPLSQFSSAGVNLSSIKKMTLGIGDPSSPKTGGAGKLYIDDIRLSKVEP